MMWCCKCGRENSSCKVYCKCGMMDPKYVGLPTPKKKNCFIQSIKDADWITTVAWAIISLGIIVTSMTSGYLMLYVGGYWFVPWSISTAMILFWIFKKISGGFCIS